MADEHRTSLPNNFESKISKMSNYSKTQIRLMPSTGSTAVIGGDVTVFKLASAKILDLSTFRIGFNAATNGTAAIMTGFPKFMASMIDRLEIVINGVTIQNIARYNHIYNIVRDYSSDYEKYTQKLMNNSDPSVDYSMAADGTITKYNCFKSTGDLITNQAKKHYEIDDFIGFLDFSEGNRLSFLNTNLVGDVEIHITWAPNTVLFTSDVTRAPTYSVTQLIAYVDAIEFKDDHYIRALEEKISNNGIHRMPFKNYRSYTTDNTVETKNCTIRVVENTNSLDKLLFTYLDINMNTLASLQLGNPTADLSATLGDVELTAANINAGKIPKSFFNYEYLKATKNTHLLNTSRYFRRSGLGLGYNATRTSTAKFQFELDSQDLHSPMSLPSVYQETLKCFELNYNNIHKCNPGIQNFEGWQKHFFVAGYSLSHLGDNKKSYIISGVDTQATAVNVAVKVSDSVMITDAAQSAKPLLITEMTSILNIGSGRAISLIP